VERLQISSGSPYENVMGYCRAVRIGSEVFVAGTAPILPGNETPEGAYDQTRRCLEIIEIALKEAGAGLEHVVRTRVYLVSRDDFEEMARAHGDAFREIRPVNTTVVIKELMDPRWLVELEVQAVVHE
jgi:enamine deaminase RidA (YjgF/YER057c/UK114 family)